MDSGASTSTWAPWRRRPAAQWWPPAMCTTYAIRMPTATRPCWPSRPAPCCRIPSASSSTRRSSSSSRGRRCCRRSPTSRSRFTRPSRSRSAARASACRSATSNCRCSRCPPARPTTCTSRACAAKASTAATARTTGRPLPRTVCSLRSTPSRRWASRRTSSSCGTTSSGHARMAWRWARVVDLRPGRWWRSRCASPISTRSSTDCCLSAS